MSVIQNNVDRDRHLPLLWPEILAQHQTLSRLSLTLVFLLKYDFPSADHLSTMAFFLFIAKVCKVVLQCHSSFYIAKNCKVFLQCEDSKKKFKRKHI